MTLSFRPFRVEDGPALDARADQWVQLGREGGLAEAEWEAVAAAGAGWTAEDAGGRMWWCGGFAERVPGLVGVAWAVFARGIGVCRHLAVTRFTRARMADCGLVRIEALVSAGSRPNRKWADLCFRTPPLLMRRFDGVEDVLVYERLG